eukprot:g13114.t1
MIGVRLEQQYVALTSDEVLSTFQLPAEAFEDLRSIVLANEDGEPTTFYLFKPEKVMRLAKFFSERELVNTDLLLEPDNMLRKEQPLESELISASSWWSDAATEYWKCAVQAQILTPQMDGDISALKDGTFTASPEMISDGIEKYHKYRTSMRKGAYEEFETLFFRLIRDQVEETIRLPSVSAVKQAGSESLLEPLEKALATFDTKASQEMATKLNKWFGVMKAEFAEEAFQTKISKFVESGSVNWDDLVLVVSKLQGSSLTTEVAEKVKGIFDLVAKDLFSKASYVILCCIKLQLEGL